MQIHIKVLNNVKETFEENVKYISHFSSDSGFSVLTNEEIESICNEYLYQLDMQTVLMNFIRHLIQTECYRGGEKRWLKVFLSILQMLLGMIITDL